MADTSNINNQDLGNAKDYRDIIRSINEEMGKKINNINDARKAYDGLESIASKLVSDEENILDLNQKQLDKLQEQAKQKLSDLKDSVERLKNEKSLVKSLVDNKNLNDELVQKILQQKVAKGELSDKEAAAITAARQNFELESDSLRLVDERIKKEKQIISNLGITGAALSSINKTMEKIGLGPIAAAMGFDELQKSARAYARQLEEDDETKGLSAMQKKTMVLQKMMGDAAKSFGSALKDPAVLFTLIYKLASDISNAVNNIQKETGMSYTQASLFNAELRTAAQNSGQLTISAEKLGKAWAEASKELGQNAEILGTDALISVSNLTNQLGMGAKQATQLSVYARMQGKDTEKVLSNTVATVSAMNKQEKTAINVKDVLNDIGSASAAVSRNLDNNPEKIAAAATAARQLGLELSTVAGIADSLLNFEDSISKELEAELLTGKQLNLEKARQAALEGDLETVSKEIANNAEIANAFASKNVIAQKAAAEALGMSVDQLAKVALQQDLNNLSAEEFKNRYGEATYESLKAQSASEKFAAVMSKLQELVGNIGMLFAPILDAVATIAGWIANILSKWYVFYPLVGLVALSYMPKIVSGFKDMGKSIADSAKSMAGMVQGLFGKGKLGDVADKVTDKITGGDKAKEAADQAADIGEKAEGFNGKKAGSNFKSLFKGISEGLQSFGKVKMSDIGKFALAGISFIAWLPAIPALLLLQLVRGPLIKSALTGIAAGIKALGKAASAPEFWIGIAGLAALGASLIPLTYALSLLAPLLEAVGNVIKSVLDGVANIITALAEGFVKLLGAISLEKALAVLTLAGALGVLGGSLLVFAIGLTAASVAAFFGGGIIDKIGEMAAMAQPLNIASQAINQMAQGMNAFADSLDRIDEDKLDSVSDFMMGAAIGGAVGGILSGIGDAVSGALGGGGEKDPLVAEMQEVKALLAEIRDKNQDIYLDSNKVGTATAKATVKTQ